VSRYQLWTDWSWEVDRRSRLSMKVPYASVSAKYGGAKYNAESIGDVQVNWNRDIRQAEVGRPGSRMYFGLNLPTGRSELNAEEAAAINAICAAAEGFENPELGRGAAATLGYGILTKSSPFASMEYSLLYTGRASYHATPHVERGDRQNLTVSAVSTRNPTPRRSVSWGVAGVAYSNEGFAIDGVPQPVAKISPDVVVSYGQSYKTNPVRRSDFFLAYTHRGVQDFFAPDGTVTRDVDLGDRGYFRLTFSQRHRPGSWFQYGAFGQYTAESKDNVTGDPVFNTERKEAALFLGHMLELRGYDKLKTNIQVGLTDDSRTVATLSYCSDF